MFEAALLQQGKQITFGAAVSTASPAAAGHASPVIAESAAGAVVPSAAYFRR